MRASAIVARRFGLIVWLASGCAGGPVSGAWTRELEPTTLTPESLVESAVLERLSSLPSGEITRIDGVEVTARPAYASASGRRCRRVSIGTREHLACTTAPDGWEYVPSLLESP